jgi:hypothetical protein
MGLMVHLHYIWLRYQPRRGEQMQDAHRKRASYFRLSLLVMHDWAGLDVMRPNHSGLTRAAFVPQAVFLIESLKRGTRFPAWRIRSA